MQSEPLGRLFSLHRRTANETKRAVEFRRGSQEELKSILARMDGEERLIASIIQPLFASLTLNQDLWPTDGFVPALALNGPHRNLASIVRQHLQAFCTHLRDTECHIRAVVAERPNSDGEPYLGLAVD